jgi:hypothetical protein
MISSSIAEVLLSSLFRSIPPFWGELGRWEEAKERGCWTDWKEGMG